MISKRGNYNIISWSVREVQKCATLNVSILDLALFPATSINLRPSTKFVNSGQTLQYPVES